MSTAEPQREPPVATPAPGDRVGRYQVLKPLGSHPGSTSLLAHDLDHNRQVVIKVWYATREPAAREAVTRAARALAWVHSPRVARGYGIVELDNTIGMVSEFIPGKSLAAVLSERQVHPLLAVKLAEELAEGLDALHAGHVLHHAIKPENIIIGDENRPWLVDARPLEVAADPAEPDEPGHPVYLAPEAARGDREAIGVRSDVFSLGAVLYRLLTGRAPFRGESREEARTAACEGLITPPRQLNPTIPGALDAVCRKALAAEPADRYQSAGELRKALHRVRVGTQLRTRMVGIVGFAIVLALLFYGLIGPKRLGTGPDAPAPTVARASRPLAGDLGVTLWTPDGRERRVGDPGALPARPGDRARMEVQLNQPAYIYLVWVDSEGRVSPLYPWASVKRDVAAEEVPLASLEVPTAWDQGWPLQGPSGLMTALMFVRRSPLRADTNIAELIGPLPDTSLHDPQEFAVLGYDPASPAGTREGQHRGPEPQAREADQPIIRVIEKLRPNFEVMRVVRFAYEHD